MKEKTLVTPIATTGQGRQAVDVVQHDIGRRAVGQGIVHPAHETPQTGRMPQLVIVQLTPRRPVETVLHDEATQPLVGRAPEDRPVGKLRIDQGGDLRAALSKGRTVDQIPPTGGQEHDVRLKAV